MEKVGNLHVYYFLQMINCVYHIYIYIYAIAQIGMTLTSGKVKAGHVYYVLTHILIDISIFSLTRDKSLFICKLLLPRAPW